MSNSLTLDNIRSSLIRQEDSIIFNFLERAQFALNPVVYTAGGIQVPGMRSALAHLCCSYVAALLATYSTSTQI